MSGGLLQLIAYSTPVESWSSQVVLLFRAGDFKKIRATIHRRNNQFELDLLFSKLCTTRRTRYPRWLNREYNVLGKIRLSKYRNLIRNALCCNNLNVAKWLVSYYPKVAKTAYVPSETDVSDLIYYSYMPAVRWIFAATKIQVPPRAYDKAMENSMRFHSRKKVRQMLLAQPPYQVEASSSYYHIVDPSSFLHLPPRNKRWTFESDYYN